MYATAFDAAVDATSTRPAFSDTAEACGSPSPVIATAPAPLDRMGQSAAPFWKTAATQAPVSETPTLASIPSCDGGCSSKARASLASRATRCP